jgi:hypothetical protein
VAFPKVATILRILMMIFWNELNIAMWNLQILGSFLGFFGDFGQ